MIERHDFKSAGFAAWPVKSPAGNGFPAKIAAGNRAQLRGYLPAARSGRRASAEAFGEGRMYRLRTKIPFATSSCPVRGIGLG
jgi:hypothetical protein